MPSTGRRPKQATVWYARFVGAWLRCDSTKEVAAALGMSANSVRTIATKLRKLGVKLPHKVAGRRKQDRTPDIRALNALISASNKKTYR